MGVKAIPTRFADIEFRSRLEATWASFFTRLGWRWEYEPIDLDGWIPDFLIFGDREFLVEVKPLSRLSELASLGETLPQTHGRDVLCVGIAPFFDFDEYQEAVMGAYGEFYPESDEDGKTPAAMWWQTGLASICRELDGQGPRSGCQQFSVQPEFGSYRHAPCGHYPGGTCGGLDGYRAQALKTHWANAKNTAKWMPGHKR